MPLKFMNAGGYGTTKDAIEAINYVIDRKKASVNVRVISASWGSTQKSKALEDVIRKLMKRESCLWLRVETQAPTTIVHRTIHPATTYRT
jgi:hypothetical protein